MTPAAGSLTAGQRVQVSVVGNGGGVSAVLRISPGGLAVEVEFQALMAPP